MIETVNIGGELRPVSFSHRQHRHYEEMFGRPFQKDFKALMDQFAPMFSANNVEELLGVAADLSIVMLGNVLFSGFITGYHLSNKPIDFDVYDLTDWILADNKAMEKLVSMVISANTSSVKGVYVDESKKKQMARIRKELDGMRG